MTRASDLTDLQTERTRIKTAIAAAQSGMASIQTDGIAFTRQRMADLRADLVRVEKSIQRLLRGGRGMQIDLSYAANDSGEAEYPATT